MLSSIFKSKYGRAGLFLSIANYFQAGIGFFISFYLANELGAQSYGTLSFGIVVGTLVSSIANFGAERTLVRDLVQRPNRDALLTSSLVLRFLFTILILVTVTAFEYLNESEAHRAPVVALCALAACFWAISPVAWFDVRYRMHHHAFITLVEKCLYLGTVYFALRVRNVTDVAVIAACLAGTRLVSFLAQLSIVSRAFRPDFTGLLANMRSLVIDNVFIVSAALSNLLISHWNQIVLDYEVSTRSLGYYSLAFQMTAVITLLQGQFVRVLFPKIAVLTSADADPHEAKIALRRYVLLGGAMSVGVALPLALVAPFVISTFFNSDYVQAIQPLRILCVWTVVFGPGRVINAFLVNLRLDRALMLCSLIAGIAAIVLGQLLIPHFNESGVALALLLGHPISIGAQYVLIGREFRRRERARTRS